MPTALRRHQYELLDRNERSLLVFGTEDTGYQTSERPLFEMADSEYADLPFGQRDGWTPGRDYLTTGGTHIFAGHVLTDKINGLGKINAEAANEAAIEEFKSAWRNPTLRNHPSAHGILRKVAADGGVWRTYGRPRDPDFVEGLMTSQGATPFTARFVSFEEGWYSDTLQSVTRKLYTPSRVALRAPIRSPITTIAETSEIAEFEVLGKRDTWPIATFYGPVSDPTAILTQGTSKVEIGLTGFIPSGQAVRISTYPWARWVRNVSDGASRSGMVSRGTPQLSTLRLTPGKKVVTYRGLDATGTSYVQIQWRTHRDY